MGTITINKCPACESDSLEHFAVVKDYSVSQEEFNLVKCPNCGLRITQEQPDPGSIGPYYQSEDYISHSDTRKGLVNTIYHKVRSHMLNKKQRLVEKYARRGSLLDVGTGTGYFINHMQNAGWSVLGLEPDEGARTYAQREFGVKVQDIDSLGTLDTGAYDAITMWHVMEHVHDLNTCVDELHRLLKEDGILVIAVPNPLSADASHYGKFWAAYDVPRHLWHFSPKSMETLLGRHGFDIVHTEGMPFDAFYVSLLSEKYRGKSLGLVRGAIAGASTNIQAASKPDKASSLIYVARKDC